MDNKTKIIISIVIIVAVILFLNFKGIGPFAAVSYGQMVRDTGTLTQLTPGQQFTITYKTTMQPAGKYLVAIEDVVTGGCSPTSYKNIIIKEDGSVGTATQTYTAPASGACTFIGTYQFTNSDQIAFSNLVLNVCQPATMQSLGKQCGTWSNNCGGTVSGTCPTGQSCNSAGQCLTCRTDADTDCNGAVTTNELINYASKWLSNQITTQQLMSAASAWLG